MKLRSALRMLVTLAGLCALPAIAHAHPGHDGHELTWDFSGGLGHPLGGLDHLLAMIAVGLWAAQLGGRARWLVPMAFLSAMALGAAAANYGVTVPWLEQGLAVSVVGLGLLVATAARPPLAAGFALTIGFAVLHGIAHGTALPAGAAGLSYGTGFMVATALLHAVGMLVGTWVRERSTSTLRRVAGVTVMTVGAVLLAS